MYHRHHIITNVRIWIAVSVSEAKLRKVTISFVMFVCPFRSARNNSAPTGRIFMKLDISGVVGKLSRKFKLDQNLTRIMGSFHEDQYTFTTTSRSVILRIRIVSDKQFRDNENARFMFSNFFSKIFPFMIKCGKILYSRTGHR